MKAKKFKKGDIVRLDLPEGGKNSAGKYIIGRYRDWETDRKSVV